jgi:hypothetical protein
LGNVAALYACIQGYAIAAGRAEDKGSVIGGRVAIDCGPSLEARTRFLVKSNSASICDALDKVQMAVRVSLADSIQGARLGD